MNDVARAAGVHRTTVSRALKNHPRIPRKTCVAIQEIARQMEYCVNPLVSALMTQKAGRRNLESASLCYLSWESDSSWDKFHVPKGYWEGASSRARELGHSMDVIRMAEPRMSIRRVDQILQARGILAICIGPLPRERSRVNLPWSKYSAASLGYTLFSPTLHRASIHHYHNCFMAIRHLRRLGYRRIGLCLNASMSSRSYDGWLAAFLVARERHPEDIFAPWLSDSRSLPVFQRWYMENRPDVVLTEDSAIEIYLRKMALKIPDDVGLATLDWNPRFAHWAGVYQNAAGVGSAAVDMLIGQLHRNERGAPECPKTILIEGLWKNGETLRKPLSKRAMGP